MAITSQKASKVAATFHESISETSWGESPQKTGVARGLVGGRMFLLGLAKTPTSPRPEPPKSLSGQPSPRAKRLSSQPEQSASPRVVSVRDEQKRLSAAAQRSERWMMSGRDSVRDSARENAVDASSAAPLRRAVSKRISMSQIAVHRERSFAEEHAENTDSR